VPDNGDNFFSRLWRRPRNRWLLGIPLGGFVMLVIGALALGSVNFSLQYTSETEFCLSCHSHAVNTQFEYEASSHFRNATGVQAGCADCHLPHGNWFETVGKKIVVSADVLSELAGKISTPEKYEAHRQEMAEKVWEEYRNNDSRYCRSCHNVAGMDFDKQNNIAAVMHRRVLANEQTCIDCHTGLVHKLPGESVNTL